MFPMCVSPSYRFSAPPGPDRSSSGASMGIRDSVVSIDYLSESQADSDDEESAQSEVHLYSLPSLLCTMN